MNKKDTIKQNEFREQLVEKLPLFFKSIFSIVGGIAFTTLIVYVLNIAAVIYGQAYAKSFGIPYLPNKIDLLDFYTNNINLTMTLALAIPVILIIYVTGWLELISSRKPTFMGVLAVFSTAFIFLFLHKNFSIYYYIVVVFSSTLILFLISNPPLKSFVKIMKGITNIPIFRKVWALFLAIPLIKKSIRRIKVTRRKNSRKMKKIILWDYAFYAFSCVYVFLLFFINIVALSAYFANSQGIEQGAKDITDMENGKYLKTTRHIILKEHREDAIIISNDGVLYTVFRITKHGNIILDHVEKKDFNYHYEIKD